MTGYSYGATRTPQDPQPLRAAMVGVAVAALDEGIRVDMPQARSLATAALRVVPRPAPAPKTTPEPRRPEMTDREMQVLLGMANGQTNAEIGRELFLAEDTVKTYARRVFRRLGTDNRAHAVALGFRWGLLRPVDVRLPGGAR